MSKFVLSVRYQYVKGIDISLREKNTGARLELTPQRAAAPLAKWLTKYRRDLLLKDQLAVAVFKTLQSRQK
jgi:hypothetical protein